MDRAIKRRLRLNQEICRICLAKTDHQSIDVIKAPPQVADDVFAYYGVRITGRHGKTTMLCVGCQSRIADWIKMKREIPLNAEKKLRELTEIAAAAAAAASGETSQPDKAAAKEPAQPDEATTKDPSESDEAAAANDPSDKQ